jgi:hypothetical protein
MLNDTNNKCRAWVSSSFMQISLRKKINMKKKLPYFYKSMKKEVDYFIIESIINTLSGNNKKEIWTEQKRFG